MSKIVTYVVEEVERQGHDTSIQDGIERVGWMLSAWAYALDSHHLAPDFGDAVALGRLVEPQRNSFGLRRCNVRVGGRICPAPSDVPSLLKHLFTLQGEITPLEFYRQFEEIHPFVDGNGRTGKVLMAWLTGRHGRGSLHDPIFPPFDLFGEPIENP